MRLLFPNKQLMVDAGFASVACVPFLLGDNEEYLAAANIYLGERALLEWHYSSDRASQTWVPSSGSYRTVATLRSIGERLKNFLQWCVHTGTDWTRAEYTEHLIVGYQGDMVRGSWSLTGRPLSSRTINQRVDEAFQFLSWSCKRGKRAAECCSQATGRKVLVIR